MFVSRFVKPSLYAAIDIGSYKISCCVVRYGDGELKTISVVRHACDGLKKGIITNMTEVENTIKKIIELTEYKIKGTIDTIAVSVSSPNIVAELVANSIKISNGVVSAKDCNNLNNKYQPPDGNEMLHLLPISYSIDGSKENISDVDDPIGMCGNTLSSKMLMIYMPRIQLDNILKSVARVNVSISKIMYSAYAAGYILYSNNEKDMGYMMIDIGHHLTSISQFYNNKMIAASVIPIGGMHITHDIAYALDVPIKEAERIKLLHCSAIAYKEDEWKNVTFKTGTNEEIKLPQFFINSVVQARLEEIFEYAKECVYTTPLRHSGNVMLFGGSTSIENIQELAQLVLRRPVRLANIANIAHNSYDDKAEENHFDIVSCVGAAVALSQLNNGSKKDGFFERIARWIKGGE